MALIAAVTLDADLIRAFLDSRGCLTPLGETLARASVVDQVLELARERERRPLPGPDRAELLPLAAG